METFKYHSFYQLLPDLQRALGELNMAISPDPYNLNVYFIVHCQSKSSKVVSSSNWMLKKCNELGSAELYAQSLLYQFLFES